MERISARGHRSATAGLRSAASPCGRYLTAVVASQYGNWLTTVTVMVMLFRLSGGAIGPAAYMLARVAPRLIGPIAGGSLADGIAPGRVAAACYAIQGACTAGIVVAAERGSTISVCIAVGLGQVAGSCGSPCESALIPQLAGTYGLGRLNSLRGIGDTTAMLIAPALGALALLVTSAETVILVDVATFGVGALLLASLPVPTSPSRRGGGRPSPFAALRPVMDDPALRVFTMLSFVNGAAVTATSAVLVSAADQRYGSDHLVGVLYAAVGVGGLLGGLVTLKWSPRIGGARLAILGVAEAAALALFSVSPSVLLGCVTLVLSAVAGEIAEVWGSAELQRRAAPGLLGRINGVVYLALFSGMLVGSVVVLLLSKAMPWNEVIVLVASVAAAIMALSAIPYCRRPTSRGIIASGPASVVA